MVERHASQRGYHGPPSDGLQATLARRLRTSDGEPGRWSRRSKDMAGRGLRPLPKLGIFLQIQPAESMGYCRRYVGLLDSRSEAFSYNKRTMDRAMRPF